jgi:hypothetical protein
MARFVPGQNSPAMSFIWSGGTANLVTDYRTAAVQSGVGLVESTAGGDSHEQWLPTTANGEFTLGILHTGGTAVWTALAPGNQGTVIVGPQGTATGSIKHTIPVVVASRNGAYPYKDVATIEVTFRETNTRTDALY